MGNFSRDTFNQLRHYVGVRLQQGVPIVDADWNEQEDIRKHELRTFLKWFVGNGVPKGNDGFRIVPLEGSENDFTIKGGTTEEPGYCLVEGWDAMIEEDISYTQQLLYNNDTLAQEWGVKPLEALSPPNEGERADTVYLDVWEREVDAQDDGNLVNQAIGIETCVRLKREWVVRVAEGLLESPNSPPGHVYYPLALLKRTANQNVITDLRRTGLSILSKEITIKDGKVGIGTPNPVSMLTVGNYTPDSRLQVNTADVGIYVVTTNPVAPPSLAQPFSSYLTKDVLEVGDRNQIRFLFKANNDNNSTGDLRFASSVEAIVEDPNNSTRKSALRFLTSGTESGAETEKMRIAGNGKVGIGTTSPDRELHVNGTMKISRSGYEDRWTTDNHSKGIELENGTSIQFLKGGVGGSRGISGNLGKLYFVRSSSDDNSATATYDMVIDADGKVGIGIQEPKTELDVNGYITKKEVAFSASVSEHTSEGDAVLLDTYKTITNESGSWDNNSKFTAPVEGLYFFTVSFIKDTYYEGGTNDDVYIGIRKNGGGICTAWSGEGSHQRVPGICSVVLKMKEGDYVETYVSSEGGMKRHLYNCLFTGFKL